MSCLYILEIKPLLFSSFANIFSCGLSFCFVYGFLCCAKAFKCMLQFFFYWDIADAQCLSRSHFFIFCFISFYLADRSKKKKDCYSLCQNVPLMFHSRSCVVSSFTFRSLIPFEFIFAYGVGECSDFILLHIVVQFFQYHLLKKLYVFSPLYILISSVVDKLIINVWLISGLSILFHWSVCLFHIDANATLHWLLW